MQYYKKYNLKNSFNLKAVANEIWFPETISELATLIKKLNNKSYHVLGSGTNIIMNEEINKVVSLQLIPPQASVFNNQFIISSNYPTHRFVNIINKNNYSGVEALYGMPGLIGGAIAMNAGSRLQTISDNLLACSVMDKNGNIKWYNKEELTFKRRYSNFQNSNEIILSAIFEFTNKNLDQELLNQIIEYRKTFIKKPNAGGIFVNWHELKKYENELRTLVFNNLQFAKSINVLFNTGNACFNNILDAINKIQSIVNESLQLEIKIWRD